MIANLPLFVGLRYTRGKQRNGFISFVSLLSFIAMSLGVTALIVVLSVMNGFDLEIKSRILNVVPHVSITRQAGFADWRAVTEQIIKHPEVEAASPYIDGVGMLTTRAGNQGVVIKGIHPETEYRVTDIKQSMIAGSLESLAEGEFGIVLGSILARSLNVVTGDSVVLSLPQLNVTPVGVFPRYKRFKVSGVFRVGAQIDNGLALINLADAQKLYRIPDNVHGLHVRTVDPFTIDKPALMAQLENEVQITTWMESMGSLFQAIKLEKTVVGTLLAAIVAVAAFNIIASLVLMVAEKRSDMAVLRTLGAGSSTVAKIFVVQGSLIGIIGVITGVVSGCLIALSVGDIVHFLERVFGFHVFDPSVYFISELPSELMWQDVLLVSALGVLLSIVATLYPAFQAGKILPAEALRYDH